MIRLACLLSITLAVACGGKKQESPPAGGSGSAAAPSAVATRLVTEAEIKTRLDAVMARLDANAKRRCTAPRVVEKALPGSGSDVIVQLVEGKGELASCMTKLGELAKAKTLKADFDAGLPSAIAFDDACGALIADKVTDAATHVEGCSPYQTGVRAEPKDLVRAIQVAHALAFHAKKLHAAGKTTEAVQLLLAGMRVMQDAMRGHVTLIVAMVAVASTQILADRMDEILETAKLSEEDRALAAAALESLLVGVPLWPDLMAGERENMDIYFAAAPLMPKDWTPPGGWNEGLRPTEDKATLPIEHFGDPRDEHAIMLLVSESAAADQARACPEGASYAVCHRGLEALVAAGTPAANQDLKALYADLEKAATSTAPDVDAIRLRIRETIVQILKGVAQPALAKYSLKIAA